MAGKRKLDTSRQAARIVSADPESNVAFEQDGILFDQAGVEVGVTDGYERLQAQKGERKALELDAEDRASRASDILGDLGVDPHADAQKENAAAAAAEENAGV